MTDIIRCDDCRLEVEHRLPRGWEMYSTYVDKPGLGRVFSGMRHRCPQCRAKQPEETTR